MVRPVRSIDDARPGDLSLPALLAVNEPVVLRGIAADWPLVAAGRAGPAATIAYLEQYDGGRPIVGYTGDPSIGGRFFYRDDWSGLNFDAARVGLSDYLDRIEEHLTRNRFNDQARREIEAVRDFVLLHYHLNQRPEPFWRERREIAPPDSLAERIALFAEGAHTYRSADDLFRTGSWTQVMLGRRLAPAAWHPRAKAMPPGELGNVLRGLQAIITATVARLPTHQQFLDSYCRSRDCSSGVTACQSPRR